MDTEEIKRIARELIDNPYDKLNELGVEEITELKKYINPLGTIVASKKSCTVLSVFNMNEAYRKKLITTALIAFTYRLIEEYEPELELAKVDKSKMDSEEKAARRKEIIDTTRTIVREFFNRHFSYDVDKHVRAAHKKQDVAATLEKHHAKFAETRQSGDAVEEKMEKSPEKLFMFLKNNTLLTQSLLTQITETMTTINTTMIDDSLDFADKKAILIRSQSKLEMLNTEFKKLSEPMSKADTAYGLMVNPPIDLFYHFDRFMSNHYEQLREMTDVIYTERADIDDIVINYDSFEGADCVEQAKEFVAQHDGEFKQEPLIIENNGITLLGPFKENKAKINYYNKNTAILKEMTEQVEMDQKLGKDLVEKRVKDKKKKNIEENGPDGAGLAAYRDAMSNIERLGGKKGLTQQEQEEYHKALTIKEDLDVPDGAIQTDVFYTDENGEMKRKKLYTQAEKPLHLQKNSPFAAKYQPRK
jgi:hypothetical protein